MTPAPYAGVGSRETPLWATATMTVTAEVLAKMGHVLRSGGAGGADSAFEDGCDAGGGRKEIFLPWRGFNYRHCGKPKHASDIWSIPAGAFVIAAHYHPVWGDLKDAVHKLMARNVQQVLGPNLDSPSRFVLCYTTNGSGSGGTGQAIRVAKAYNIPVFDMGNFDKHTIAEPLYRFLLDQDAL